MESLTTKSLLSRVDVQQKFKEMLGKNHTQFITSILQCVSSSEQLSKAEPMSIYHSAIVAATLNLPINNNLGLAHIVPYNQRQKDGSYKTVAQFQIGYKGFIQLAQRSGTFKTISVTPVYDGQILEMNPLTGFKFDFSKKTSDKVIGFAAYFSLINGFEKTLYMSVEEVTKHANKFSQTYKKGFGLWKDEFESMACKTVLKLLLSKYAPLSIDMEKAVVTDQAVIKDEFAQTVDYVDAETIIVDKEAERINSLIESANSEKELRQMLKGVNLTDNQTELFNQKILSFDGK